MNYFPVGEQLKNRAIELQSSYYMVQAGSSQLYSEHTR